MATLTLLWVCMSQPSYMVPFHTTAQSSVPGKCILEVYHPNTPRVLLVVVFPVNKGNSALCTFQAKTKLCCWQTVSFYKENPLQIYNVDIE